LIRYAYDDNPLPIGSEQTISQPYIVAFMTELIKPQKGQRVLEVGTGSGYQAAVLAEIVDSVYSIEILPELAESAERRLKQMEYGILISDVATVMQAGRKHHLLMQFLLLRRRKKFRSRL